MNNAAPDGTPPRRISDKKFKKIPAHRFGETLRYLSFLREYDSEYDFRGPGVNRIDSCLFLKEPG